MQAAYSHSKDLCKPHLETAEQLAKHRNNLCPEFRDLIQKNEVAARQATWLPLPGGGGAGLDGRRDADPQRRRRLHVRA